MNMRKCICIDNRVALVLEQLRSDNALILCVDLYGIAHNIVSIIKDNCCKATQNHVRPLVFEKPTLPHIWKKKIDFEDL